MLDSTIEQIVKNSQDPEIIDDYKWRKTEVEQVNRRAKIDSLGVGSLVDFRTKDYVWHPGIVKRMRMDPLEKRMLILIGLLVS